MSPKAENIPAEMRELSQWILWKYEVRDDKTTKVPFQTNGMHHANVTDRATWGTFDDAVAGSHAPHINGIGFVLTPDDPYFIIDLDNKPDRPLTDEERPVHERILGAFHTYTERSIGGLGYHVVGRGSIPRGIRRGNVEIYSQDRYMVFTGDAINALPINDCQPQLSALWSEMRPADPLSEVVIDGDEDRSDAEVVMRANNAENGGKFIDLCNGDWEKHGYGSQSEADLGLMNFFCFNTKNNTQAMRLFRSSKLGKRDKAQRDDYLEGMIRKIRGTPKLTAATEVAQPPSTTSIFSPVPTSQPGNSSPMLKPVPLADLMTNPPPPVGHVLGTHMPRRAVTLLTSHGGMGKSILSETIAAHVACGRPWAGLQVSGRRSAFISLEDPGDVVSVRLRRIIDTYDLDTNQVLSNLIVLDGTDLGIGLMSESAQGGVRMLTETAVFEELRQAVKGVDLIVLDNASDAADFDENTRRHVRPFIRALGKVARDNNAAFLLLAHIDKHAARYGSNGESYSGSTAWHNSVRSRLALVASDSGVVELRHEKSNLGPRAEPISLYWNDAGVLIPVSAEAVQAGVFARDSILTVGDADRVFTAIRQAHAAGVNVSNARTGSHTTKHCLLTFDLPRELTVGKAERFWRAIERLISDGRIAREEYRTEQRKIRERLVPVELLRPCASEAPMHTGAPTGASAQSAPRQWPGGMGDRRGAPIGATDSEDPS